MPGSTTWPPTTTSTSAPGKHPIEALEIWHGGLGIWGAIAGGALGATIAARRMGIRMLPLMDALAPGLLLAQAIGRWGNYFNQELFGRPTTLPWGLKIDAAHRPDGFEQFATFHPTFLYECLWNLGGMGLLVWADRRFRLGYGRVFALYVMIYTAGRGWIESLRIDTIELDNVLGLRWGVWMSIILFVLAAAYFVWSLRARPGRESSPYVEGRGPAAETAEQSDRAVPRRHRRGRVTRDDDVADPDDDVPARETGTSSSIPQLHQGPLTRRPVADGDGIGADPSQMAIGSALTRRRWRSDIEAADRDGSPVVRRHLRRLAGVRRHLRRLAGSYAAICDGSPGRTPPSATGQRCGAR